MHITHFMRFFALYLSMSGYHMCHTMRSAFPVIVQKAPQLFHSDGTPLLARQIPRDKKKSTHFNSPAYNKKTEQIRSKKPLPLRFTTQEMAVAFALVVLSQQAAKPVK